LINVKNALTLRFYKVLILVLSLTGVLENHAQLLPVDSSFSKPKFIAVGTGIVAGATLSIAALNKLWYSDFPKDEWHTFNDNKEWLQMDKVGHSSTTFMLSRMGYDLFRFSGLDAKRSIWISGIGSFVYMGSIEILDGYSQDWGFSWGDIAANGIGSALFVSQQLLWNDTRIKLKYSFHTTSYAQQRPDLLGESIGQQMLKDYNGQTYWVDINIHSFLNKESKFPRWLNLSLGYGAEGMLGAFENAYPYNSTERYRQYYLSFDIDFMRIPTHSKLLKSLFTILSFVKTPLPTLEFSQNKMTFHPLYF